MQSIFTGVEFPVFNAVYLFGLKAVVGMAKVPDGVMAVVLLAFADPFGRMLNAKYRDLLFLTKKRHPNIGHIACFESIQGRQACIAVECCNAGSGKMNESFVGVFEARKCFGKIGINAFNRAAAMKQAAMAGYYGAAFKAINVPDHGFGIIRRVDQIIINGKNITA